MSNFVTKENAATLMQGIANKIERSKIQKEELPTASEDELGNIYQFVGATGGGLVNGYFYKCVSDGGDPATYSWEEIAGMDTAIITDVNALPADPDIQDKLYRISTTGNIYSGNSVAQTNTQIITEEEIRIGDFAPMSIGEDLSLPTDVQSICYFNNKWYAFTSSKKIFISDDNGETFTELTTSDFPTTLGIDCSIVYKGKMYVTTLGTGSTMYYTSDGLSWTAISSVQTGTQRGHGLIIRKYNGVESLYVTGPKVGAAYTNNGTDFTLLDLTASGLTTSKYGCNAAIDPKTNNIYFVSANDKTGVYVIDAKNNLTKISASFGKNPNGIAIYNNLLWIGQFTGGLYVYDFETETWNNSPPLSKAVPSGADLIPYKKCLLAFPYGSNYIYVINGYDSSTISADKFQFYFDNVKIENDKVYFAPTNKSKLYYIDLNENNSDFVNGVIRQVELNSEDNVINPTAAFFTGTIAEWNAVADKSKYEYVNILDDGETGSEDTYSTTEVNTGKKWIDSKPIYRRIFAGVTPSTVNENSNVFTNIQNIDWIISLTGIVKIQSGYSYPIGLDLGDTTSINAWYSSSNSSIRMRVGRESLINSPVKIVMEYTKPTD